MKKYLLLSIFLLILSGCTQNLPVDIWIDNNFDEREEVAILISIQRWEEATGRNIFTYRGRYKDNYFTFSDMDDNRHVIYKIREPSVVTDHFVEATRARKNDSELELHGYGLHSDVLIYWYNFAGNENGDYFDLIDTGHDEYEVAMLFLSYKLEDLVMHELGHFLGLGHNNNRESIMCLERNRITWPGAPEISEYDIRNFCRIYYC